MKILIPIDFSPDALKALEYATTLARLTDSMPSSPEAGTELLIYHAFQIPAGGDTHFFVDSAMLDKAERDERDKLRQLISTIPEIEQFPYRMVTRMAMPEEGIRQVIDEESVDLVVMGVRGANESAQWLGSTAFQIIKNSPCPVLVVPRITEVFQPKQVAFATDLEAVEDIPFLPFLKKLVLGWKATLQVVHVHSHPAKMKVTEAVEALVLDRVFENIPHSCHFPEDDDPAHGIAKFLQSHAIDLLIMIPRQHNALESIFHKSITKYMSSHISVPLLTLPDKA